MSIIKKMQNLKNLIFDKRFRTVLLADKGFYSHMSDEKYLKKMYQAKMGKKLNLDHPVTFNEKLQWLKLYNRESLYSILVDKYAVRDYITRKLGEEYLIPLLGVWDEPKQIDFGKLPNQFVLKCTHNSGLGMYICRDKSALTTEMIEEIRNNLNKGLKQDYYIYNREWPYKNASRKIIAEKYMTNDSNSDEFTDYKFFCFNGYVDCVMICLERNTGDTKFYFFDKNWELKRLNKRGLIAPTNFTIPKPKCMDKMFEIAEELSKGFPFIRVDLYQSMDKIYFGELTFYPDSGFDDNILQDTDQYFGNLIDISMVGKARMEENYE